MLLTALAAPFAAAAHGAASLVGPLSRGAAGALLGLLAPLSVPPPALVALEPAVSGSVEAEPESVPVAGPEKAPRRGAARPAPPVKPTALFVSQATVLKLAESAARPRGAFVPRTADHPAGLRLAGVSGLGIGVQEGDILIEALGISPRAPGELIGAIIEARAKNARFLSGTLWRRGDTFRITVEQPYLPAKG